MSLVSLLNERATLMLNRDFAIQEASNERHLKTELLDVEDFIKVNEVQEITDPIFFVRNGVPTPEGLLSNEIFGITKEERSNIFGYIDLYDWFLHPLAYIEWCRMDSRIKDIVFGTKKFIINDKGDFEEDSNGKCGIKFLKDNFDKINIKSTESSKRDNKIKFLKDNKDKIFIKKFMVIPAYYRDVNYNDGGRVGVGQLNKYYSSLIIAVRSLKETQEYGLSMSDMTKGRIQETLVIIYNSLCGTGSEKADDGGIGLSKKQGLIRNSVMSKTADDGSRLVISAPNIRAENIESLMVDTEHCALPLASALVNFKPFIIFNVKRFFENEFSNSPTHTLINKDGETVTAEIKNPEMVFSDEEIEKQMNKFIHGYSKRLTPVDIPLSNGGFADALFKGQLATKNQIENDPSRNTLLSRRLTWCDVFYIAAVEATRDKCVLITRFPMDSYWNQFPAKIRVSSTNNTELIVIGSTYYRWYPKIRESDINKNTSNLFIDTLQFTNLNLKSVGGDYDGDQVGVTL